MAEIQGSWLRRVWLVARTLVHSQGLSLLPSISIIQAITTIPFINLQPSRSQVHVAPYILGRLEGICYSPGPRYTSGSQVHVAPQVPAPDIRASGTRRASCFGWIRRYLQPCGSQVHVAPYVLGGLKGTCNLPGPRYTLRLIFWVD